MVMFIGYHGTSRSNSLQIQRTNFSIDYRKIGWLGTGIYFFDEGEKLAEDWSSYRFPKSNDVLRCEIEIPDEEVFDVTNPNSYHSELFHAIRKEFLEQQIKDKKIDVIVKSRQDLDGKMYNLISRSKNFRLIRALTYTYTDTDREHGLFSRVPNGIELCLKQPAYVKNKSSIYDVTD